MKLEQQLEALSEIGLRLNDGVTVDDLFYSFDRRKYEMKPFDLILFVLGIEVEREPWGRWICSSVWNFDMECIADAGDYVQIVKRLCELAGQPNLMTDIEDFVDLETGQAWLQYSVAGEARHYPVHVNNDWADPDVVAKIMSYIERDGFRFYAKDNGRPPSGSTLIQRRQRNSTPWRTTRWCFGLEAGPGGAAVQHWSS